MKDIHLISISGMLFSACLLAVPLHAQEADVTKGLDTFANDLASQIKQSGKKKVAVLDFTDLNGSASELGRFIAEQVTVDLVAKRQGNYAVEDRANLKKILDEHRLTEEGLVNPENAKKLGQISGLDALILGNITILKEQVKITAKVIATDTAEIVGASQAQIQKTKDIEELLKRGISAPIENVTGAANNQIKQTSKKISQRFDDLEVEITACRFSRDKTVVVDMALKNLNEEHPIRVSLNALVQGGQCIPQTFIIDEKENKAQFKSIKGILSPEEIQEACLPSGHHWSGVGSIASHVLDHYINASPSWAHMNQIEVGDICRCKLEFVFPEDLDTANIGIAFHLRAPIVVVPMLNKAKASYKVNDVSLEIRPQDSGTQKMHTQMPRSE